MSPRTPQQFEEIRTRRIDQIKQTALRLFAERGYTNTSVSAIAREAGVSKGLMYNYFNSKEELLHAILEDALALNLELVTRLQSVSDPKDRLRQAIEAVFTHVQQHVDYWRLFISLAFQPAVSGIVQRVLDHMPQAVIDFAIEAFRQMGHVDPERDAWFFAAALDGMLMHYLQLGSRYPLAEMQRYLMVHFVDSTE